jgi:hypothetical protein
MSLKRYAAKRDRNEPAIVEALRAAGATVHSVSQEGLPDLLVGFRDVTYLLEVKAPGGSRTQAQTTFFDEWRGGPAQVVWSVDEALKAIGAVD